MKACPLLFLVLSARCFGGTLLIEPEALPDLIEHEILPDAVIDRGFYPAHAPPGVYTQQQIDAALAGLAPMEKGILWSSTEHRSVGDTLASTTTVVDPNGALHGVDFTGDPFDHESWLVPGAPDLTVDVRHWSTRLRTSRNFTEREYVLKPRAGSGGPIGSTVDISSWTQTLATDLVEAAAPVLKYSPSTVPFFIPTELVQQALAGATPGQEVPLATGYGVLPLGIGEGETTETVYAYDVELFVDYIGDPDDYFTWIAIGDSSIQVSAHLITEQGQRFLDQSTEYRLVVPDGTGQIIQNPKITVVTEVTDTTGTWDKNYFTPGNVPPEVEPSDAAVLATKVTAGTAGMALHTTVDTPGTTERTVVESIDAHGAVAGVDYSGNPANPATWTALTPNDVVADRLETVTLTTGTEAEHRVHVLYREASSDPGQTGQLHRVENAVVGRDIVRVTRRYLNRPLDLEEDLPEGLSPHDIQQALAWADPGETVVAGQTRVRTLRSTQTTPLPDIIDTNGWTYGTDFTGDPGDMNTWQAAGPSDVYIDIYHPVSRTRDYDEVVTNHLVIAPNSPPVNQPALTVLSTDPGPPRGLHVTWSPPFGMEFEVETSNDLSLFTPVPGLYKADGRQLRHSGFFSPAQPAGFLRVKRR
ncbi:hypothetical protein OKA05_04260 [Luteolibacter arcticus]|uniref:Uncharacterized protein n=1 Tax=Luteolibacter arcticus TaxID=1581411 RepID=A0ABT3GEN7_9BACT|nr:hypothetical protein [Luteolibacter arcticus]MCW1921753.1 hypothetical protein [Luteolibacter arcticus]